MNLLPEGFGLELAPGVRRHAGGRVLAGGSPLRVLRLSEAGRRAVAELEAGRVTTTAARELGGRLVAGGLANPIPGDGVRVPAVTIVVPAHDRLTELDACLRSLRQDADAHVVVVDDGSSQAGAVAELCRRHDARLLRRERSGGPAAARNAGLAVVRTELVAFLDSDCTAPAGWLSSLGRHFADPRVGAVAPRVTPQATQGASVSERYAASRSPLDLGPGAGAVAPGRPVGYVPAAALVARTAAITDGFDESLRHGEDIDLVWRLHERGWIVRYDPRVAVCHHEPAGWGALLQRRYRYGTSAAPLSRRHPGGLTPAVIPVRPAAALALALADLKLPAAALTLSASLRHAPRLRRAGLPAAVVGALGPRAVWRTLLGVSRASTTLGAPVLAAALIPRPTRRGAAVLLAASPVAEWITRRPALDPVRWAAASIVDDVAYGAGVWHGCLRVRTAGPLTPRLARPDGRPTTPRAG